MTTILCSSEQVPTIQNAGPRWQGYATGTPESTARALFARRYGVAPKSVTVKVTGGGTLAGPIPERVPEGRET